ncbi:glycosyl hydrolase family 8 [Frondihabitans cladoniiphilus]|uniref:Endoglucanase n=1 Tax=Frondihabitans cladoniiphilus TaxID=715785 RepID=A0ABP8VTQ4_9MICO
MTAKTKALVAAGSVAALLVAGGFAGLAVGAFGPTTSSSTGGTASPQPSVRTTTGLPSTTKPTTRSATSIGQAFLADWVTDGRVIRRDQGGDTVSEGQAYGMLVAVGIGDEKSFRSIWSWTEKNLQRSDGSFAWRYDGGKVVDDMPAADADVDIARALVLAGKKFDDASYTQSAARVGSAVLDTMTAVTPDGRILLPGPWAQGAGPWSYNPSYAAPASFAQMATATGDARWTELEAGSRAVTGKILDATALPSDWAQVRTDGSVVPLPSATGTAGTVQYGYDAGRLAVRYAESCEAPDVALAARLLPALAGKTPLPMQLDLGGTALNADQSPLGYVARAAAEAGAGERTAAAKDLVAADRLAQSTPTYYGAAWDALGALQLQANALSACSPLKGQ